LHRIILLSTYLFSSHIDIPGVFYCISSKGMGLS
jgi:hypothetical protein